MITLLCSTSRFNCVDVAVEYYLSERWQLEMLILTPWWCGKVKHCFQQNDRPVENTKDCFNSYFFGFKETFFILVDVCSSQLLLIDLVNVFFLSQVVYFSTYTT